MIDRFPIVLTGAGGMLAWDLKQVLAPLIPAGGLVALDHQALDITRSEDVMRVLSALRPAIVINAAAYTNVDGAETERGAARAINFIGCRNLAMACRELGARLIHFSTDQVFDGRGDTPWSEEDEPTPANYYAQTKLEGERAVLETSSALVLRVQWLYGDRKDRFTILRGRDLFTPFADQYGAPTWTLRIAQALVALIERQAEGLFHFAYDDYASWAQVFEFVKEELGLATKLVPKRTAEVALAAKRPLFSVMSNRKLAGFLGLGGMGSWREPLSEFLRARGNG